MLHMLLLRADDITRMNAYFLFENVSFSRGVDSFLNPGGLAVV